MSEIEKGLREGDYWRAGARAGDPDDICPRCGQPRCFFASDFKKMGKRSVRACGHCQKVYDCKLGGRWNENPVAIGS